MTSVSTPLKIRLVSRYIGPSELTQPDKNIHEYVYSSTGASFEQVQVLYWSIVYWGLGISAQEGGLITPPPPKCERSLAYLTIVVL